MPKIDKKTIKISISLKKYRVSTLEKIDTQFFLQKKSEKPFLHLNVLKPFFLYFFAKFTSLLTANFIICNLLNAISNKNLI